MRKKSFFIYICFLLFFSIFSHNLFAQADSGLSEPIQEQKQLSDENKTPSFKEQIDFTFQFNTTFYISPESKQYKSNVINIIYPITVGVLWPNDYFVGFQPTLSFVIMPFLWAGNMALPAEIENRTATVLSTFINWPAVFTINFKKSQLQFSTGFGTMFNYGFLSSGVNKPDPGYNGNTAEQDVKLINNWMWDNFHWLYLTFGTSWTYQITNKVKVGPAIDINIPIGILIDQHNAQGLMCTVGIKLSI